MIETIHRTIPAKKFRPLFSCHFTKIGCSLTFTVIMIDVSKLKFEIYYCHPLEHSSGVDKGGGPGGPDPPQSSSIFFHN
jgi:hypothetical protein